MAKPTPLLDPFSTKPRETMKVNPRDQVGGPMEYIEEMVGGSLDLILKGPEGPLVNEGPEYPTGSFPSSGSIENFNESRGGVLNYEGAMEQPREVIQQAIENQQIDARRMEAAQEDARFETSVLDDDQFAGKADYKNTSFRGALRTIANKVYVFMKLVAEKLKLIKEKSSSIDTFAGTLQGRLSRKDYFMQHNMAGERSGGQHVLNAAG